MHPVTRFGDAGAGLAENPHMEPTHLGFAVGHEHPTPTEAHVGRWPLLRDDPMRTGLARHRGQGLVAPREHPGGKQRGRLKRLPLEPGKDLGHGGFEVHEPELAGRLPKVGQMVCEGPAGRLVLGRNAQRLG